MSFEWKQPSGVDLIPSAFVRRWEYVRKQTEAENVKRAAALASKGFSRIHLLSIDSVDHGFVTVGIQQLQNQKQFHLHVEYLFVSAPFRKKSIAELDGLHVSVFLMGQVIKAAIETSRFAPLNSIVLETASDKLFPLYRSLAFDHMPSPSNWMYLPLTK